MAKLYSFLNQTPNPLPFRIFVDGVERTDPSTFTEEELEKAGYFGPIEFPPHDGHTQYLHWNGFEYEVITKSEEQLRAEEFALATSGIDYASFWKALIQSVFYTRIKQEASLSLTVNTLCTELIAVIMDARLGQADPLLLRDLMGQLLSVIRFDVDELDGLYAALVSGGMQRFFVIPGYVPPEPPVRELSPGPV